MLPQIRPGTPGALLRRQQAVLVFIRISPLRRILRQEIVLHHAVRSYLQVAGLRD